jgi:hypothetical protein
MSLLHKCTNVVSVFFVSLSIAKNLAFTACCETLHFVQGDTIGFVEQTPNITSN